MSIPNEFPAEEYKNLQESFVDISEQAHETATEALELTARARRLSDRIRFNLCKRRKEAGNPLVHILEISQKIPSKEGYELRKALRDTRRNMNELREMVQSLLDPSCEEAKKNHIREMFWALHYIEEGEEN